MTTYADTPKNQTSKGGRVRWPPYTPQERSVLERKFLGDWESLDFSKAFWNPIYDEEDLSQYRRATGVWRMRLSGRTFEEISKELQVDARKANALFSGRNLRTHLIQMYLNSQMLSEPMPGWRWVLECTPKPTNMFPKATAVPESVQSYQDILKFLEQFPPVHADHPAVKFFGLSSQWVEQHKPELFGFLLGFLLGDAGKNYPEYEYRLRRPYKTTLSTNMAVNQSNIRILRFFQLCLTSVGIDSRQLEMQQPVIRWVSPASSLLTWVIRVCLGLQSGQRTSRNPVSMNWILNCPRTFIVAFIQGLGESDGHVDNLGRYCNIASKVNSAFFVKVLHQIGIESHAYPIAKPKETRMTLRYSLKLPLFNPLIYSYRYESMIRHASLKHLFPPSLSFSRKMK